MTTLFVDPQSGDDARSGESDQTAVRTLARAAVLARGRESHVLLRRGTLARETFRPGASVLGLCGYGRADDPAPIIMPPAGKAGIEWTTGRLDKSPLIELINIIAEPGTGGIGIRAIVDFGFGPFIRRCTVSGFKDNVVVQGKVASGRLSSVRITDCTITDASNPTSGGKSQGIFLAGCVDPVIENNVLDRNGAPSILNQAIYIQHSCVGATVRGNAILRGAAHAIQCRADGAWTIADNLIWRCPLAIMGSHGSTGCQEIARNVILEPTDIDEANARGLGIEIKPTFDGFVCGNILAHRRIGPGGPRRPGYAIRRGKIDPGSYTLESACTIIGDNLVSEWDGAVYERLQTPFVGSDSVRYSEPAGGFSVPTLAEHHAARGWDARDVESIARAIRERGWSTLQTQWWSSQLAAVDPRPVAA